MIRRLSSILLLCCTALGAQETPTPPQGPAPQRPAAQAIPQISGDYQLMPGDVVDIRFFYNPELNEQGVAIRPDGRIELQLVGDFLLATKTPEQARKTIEEAYASRVRTPSVTVQIRKFGSAKVFVTGEVPKPGLIELEGPLTVLGALGEAGGISTKGNRKKIALIRKTLNGTPNMRQLTLFSGGQATPDALMILEPFDVLLVPESTIGRVDRWVDQWLKQLSPANLVVGFQYLKQSSIPVF